MRLLIINGPNLNLLGIRQPEIYGTMTLADIISGVQRNFPDLEIDSFQSNHEGALIDRIHATLADGTDGIVINPGAYAHYSYALADALSSVAHAVLAVEVHISDISKREEFRRRSVTAPACVKCIAGFGADGYSMAVRDLVQHINKNHK